MHFHYKALDMIKVKHNQNGQALVLVAVTIAALIGFAGLAIDSGMALSDRSKAQAAADSAAMTAAVQFSGNPTAAINAGLNIADLNGFDNDGTTNTVTIQAANANSECVSGNGRQFTVNITSVVPTTFSSAFGIQSNTNHVQAISLKCLGSNGPLFNGNAVVGLSPYGYSYHSGNSNAAQWTITGGGIFANNDAYSKRTTSVTFLPSGGGNCVTAVGDASSNWSCTPSEYQTSQAIPYTYNSMKALFPYPSCPEEAIAVKISGTIHEAPGYEGQGSNVSSWEGHYAPGVYCINDPDGNYHGSITGSDVTFYLRGDVDFKFNGGGYFGATAPTSGPYAGILVLGDPLGAANPDAPLPYNQDCTQHAEFRGNGTAMSKGTIYLPAACIDFRGNADGALQRTQLIGYTVTSNGDAGVAINFNSDDNFQTTSPGMLQLLR